MKKKSILKNKNLLEGLILALLSIFFIIESLKLHSSGSWALSPALFPLIITVSTLLLSIRLIFKGLKERDIVDSSKKIEDYKKLGFIIFISFLYLFSLPRIHFLFSSIIYLFLFLIILGERKWWVIVSISVLTPLLIQFLFGNLLNVFLP